MKMHIRSPALVFEEKSGEKKGSYYASKCSKLSRNVCNLIHSEDQLQRITLLESQMHIPYHAQASVHSPMKRLNNFNSLSLKLWESAWIVVKGIPCSALRNRNLLQHINVQGLIPPRSTLSKERLRFRQNISLTGRIVLPSLCNGPLCRGVQQQKNDPLASWMGSLPGMCLNLTSSWSTVCISKVMSVSDSWSMSSLYSARLDSAIL